MNNRPGINNIKIRPIPISTKQTMNIVSPPSRKVAIMIIKPISDSIAPKTRLVLMRVSILSVDTVCLFVLGTFILIVLGCVSSDCSFNEPQLIQNLYIANVG